MQLVEARKDALRTGECAFGLGRVQAQAPNVEVVLANDAANAERLVDNDFQFGADAKGAAEVLFGGFAVVCEALHFVELGDWLGGGVGFDFVDLDGLGWPRVVFEFGGELLRFLGLIFDFFESLLLLDEELDLFLLEAKEFEDAGVEALDDFCENPVALEDLDVDRVGGDHDEVTDCFGWVRQIVGKTFLLLDVDEGFEELGGEIEDEVVGEGEAQFVC